MQAIGSRTLKVLSVSKPSCKSTLYSKHSPTRIFYWLILSLGLTLSAGSANATRITQRDSAQTAPAPSAKSKSKRSQQVRITSSQNNSGETPAQRDRRLYRECRGLPNSGACVGYAYGPSARR